MLLRIFAFAVLFSACVPPNTHDVHYDVSDTREGAAAPPRAANCNFDILRVTPSRPFTELGGLDTEDYYAADSSDFRDAITEQVCNTGGDAVIARINSAGYFESGTIIRYDKPTTPATPTTPAAPTTPPS